MDEFVIYNIIFASTKNLLKGYKLIGLEDITKSSNLRELFEFISNGVKKKKL